MAHSISTKQRACLAWYLRAHVHGWTLHNVPAFHPRTIKSLQRRRWLTCQANKYAGIRICSITSAGIKALGSRTTAGIVAAKAATAREFQFEREKYRPNRWG